MSKDLFSKQSDLYARYRPGYPSALIEHILRYVSGRQTAWDCATGNGQAAALLASHFELVEATDISRKQISNSIQLPNIHYSISSAEKTIFPAQSFNLITVAQAYHWFNFRNFEIEAKRVLKPDGIVAIWGYSLASCDWDDLNTVIASFYKDATGAYWDPERKYIDDHYRTVPFPYKELPPKEFIISIEWNQKNLSGYLNTWSSVQHFIRSQGFNPVDELQSDLQKAWPEQDIISFRFPLFLRVGKINND
jgi:ubiquinone/menaquinone biosynthesis C-methylase UbiE